MFELINRILILVYKNRRWVVASFVIFTLGALVAGDVQAARFYLRRVAENVYSREEPKP